MVEMVQVKAMVSVGLNGEIGNLIGWLFQMLIVIRCPGEDLLFWILDTKINVSVLAEISYLFCFNRDGLLELCGDYH